MQTPIFIRSLALASMAALSVTFTSCNNDDDLQEQPASEAPASYNFENVNHGGQTVRLLLLKDLETEMEKAKTQPVSKAALMAIFQNSNNLYTEISTGKRLSDKVANAQDLQQIETWFEEIETLSNRPEHGYVTTDGVDLKQMVAKTIMGSVFYYRALNDYLDVAKLTADDNATVTPGTGTVMEHHYDEGFGYFGAAHNMNQYTDAELVSPGRKDANGDGAFDAQTEVNYYYAQTAAKRDIDFLRFTSTPTDYTGEIFTALVRGRHFITKKQYTERNAEIVKVRALWDEMLAATAIHYAEQVKSDLNGLGTTPTQTQLNDLAKHWSEMKAYYGMMRHNPDKKLNAADYSTIDAKLGTNSSSVSVTELESAIVSLKSAFSF